MQSRSRRRGPAARSGAVVTGAVLATVLLAGCSGSSDAAKATGTGAASSAAPTRTSAAATTSPHAAVPTGKGAPATRPVGAPSVAISTAPAVKAGKITQISQNVLITVDKVKDLTVKAQLPGEIAGPAAAVQVTVRNRSAKAFNLNGMVVTAFYDDGTPANETSVSPSKPMNGSLKVGATSKGVYVFSVPKKYASSLHVEVSSDESPTIVQFVR